MTHVRKVLILDANYPSESNHYGDVFVHARVKEYKKQAEVVVASVPSKLPNWQHEGVEVRAFAELSGLVAFIREYQPDVLCGHFVEGSLIDEVFLRLGIPAVIWVHGYEALGWYRRLFSIRSSKELAVYLVRNTIQMARFGRLIRHGNRSGRSSFIFVSQWVRRAAQFDTMSEAKHAYVVPNPIDGHLFAYREKNPSLRTRILMIRSFNSKKYATDIATDSILHLSRHRAFNQFEFSIYGRGHLFAETAAKLHRFKNVHMYETFLPQRSIPALHAQHGVMLCPTRQDTHGVSMCEAMSSGLVPLTSRNTAIPEYVTDGVSGILTRSAKQLAQAMLQLYEHPDLFVSMSRSAAESVRQQCGLEEVISRELEIMENTVARARGRSSRQIEGQVENSA